MNLASIVELQLEAEFGVRMPQMVQKLVDAELNAGIWKEGYDLAVNPPFNRQEEGQELLDVVLQHYPDYAIDLPRLREEVEAELPQSDYAKVLWLVDSRDGSFCLTDSLRVARWNPKMHLWTSPRVSYDGISLEAIEGLKLRGLSFNFDTYDTDLPFILDWEKGSVIEGEVIEI